MSKFIIPTLVAVSLAASVTPASAKTYTAYVDYADLDLAQAAGRNALVSRIDRAIDEVCGTGPIMSRVLYESRARCQTQAADMAYAQAARLVGNVQLIAQLRDEYLRGKQRKGG